MTIASANYTPKKMLKTESHKESFTVECIHRIHWINQGLVGCNIGRDPSKCSTCSAKQPQTFETTVTTASFTLDEE